MSDHVTMSVHERSAQCNDWAADVRAGLRVLFVTASFVLGAFSGGLAQTEEPGAIWGKLDFLTNTYVVVDGKRYNYSKDQTSPVIIHTRSLTPDKRGNVKISLNTYGEAVEVSFYGIDEPEALTRFFRNEG